MPWWTPRTWATADAVDAAMLNEQVRDNLNDLKRRADALENYQATTTGTWTSSSSSFITVMGVTINLAVAGPVFMQFDGMWSHSVLGGDIRVAFQVAGTRLGDATFGQMLLNVPVATYRMPICLTHVASLASGNTTINVQAATGSGANLTIGEFGARLMVVSLRGPA